MKSFYSTIIAILSIITILFVSPIISEAKTSKVVIDPGHGGYDSGAVNGDVKESDINLSISKKINTYLTNTYNIQTKMTRTSDKSLGNTEKKDLQARVKIANDWKADLFVSIHANSDSGKASGYEDFIYPGSQSGATGEMQDAIHKEITSVLKKYKLKDRGKKTADFHVLRESEMSAILIEVAFLDNASDLKTLKNKTFQSDFAKAVSRGIANFLDLQDKTYNFKKGDYHKNIITLKSNLAKAGFTVPGNGTNYFGSQAEEQVKAFQSYYGLTADGIFGKASENKLNEVVNSPLQRGKRDNNTVQLKKDLAIVGFKVPGNSTTLFGSQTEKQVKAFQKKYKLVQNGIADSVTLNKLSAVKQQVIDPTLKKGVTHKDVKQLKQKLAKVGFAVPGNGTSYFGVQTDKQLKAFQSYYGLKADGIFGKASENKLNEVVNSPLQKGKRDNNTVQLKKDLAIVGFKVPGNGTTLFGSQTEKQVKAFQKKYKLVQNGIADSVTLNKLSAVKQQVIDPTLKKGVTHKDVKQLKQKLAKAGFTVPGNGTSYFGVQTDKQLKAFQSYYGLKADGVFGKTTENKLNEVVNSPLQKGKRHNDVKTLKKNLAKAGFEVPGKGTTLFGTQTEKKVKAFQKKHNLIQNGIVDSVTLNKLKSIIK